MNLKEKVGSEFLKNTLVVVGGTIGAQAIALIAQPFLRRIYPPETFGFLSIFISITGILVIISSLRFELTITLPKSTRDSENLLAGALIINLFYGIILEVLVLVFQYPILTVLHLPEEFSINLHLVAPAVFLFGIYQSISYWLIRTKRFSDTSYVKLSRRLTEASAQSLFGKLNMMNGLIMGEVIGRFILAMSSIWFLIKSGFQFRNIQWKIIQKKCKEYSDYPKYSTLPTLLNAIGLLFPAIIINRLYGAKETGLFDACLMVLSVPVSFVSVSISNVLTQRLSESYRKKEKVLDYVLKLLKGLSVISVVGLMIVYFFAPYLFGLFFGEEYVKAGEYASILSFGFAARFIVSSFAVVFAALNKIRNGVIWQYFYFGAISSLLLLKNIEITTFLTIYTIVELVMYSLYMIQILIECRKHDRSILII